jgi:hypothetical protein
MAAAVKAVVAKQVRQQKLMIHSSQFNLAVS